MNEDGKIGRRVNGRGEEGMNEVSIGMSPIRCPWLSRVERDASLQNLDYETYSDPGFGRIVEG